jgi:4-hydroxybenzoate polyprenyltransferase
MRWLDAFFALRPLVLIPAWSFFLLGWGASAQGAVPWWRLLQLTAVLMATYLVNQVVDVETDRINDKGLFLQRGVFTRRQYVLAAIVLLGASLLSAWRRGDALLLLVGAAVLGLAYSLPPLRLSHRPWFDLLANGLGYGAVAFVLGRGAGAWDATAVAQVVCGVMAVGAVFLHTTLLDLAGDRRCGKRTTGVVLGPGATRRLATLLATLSLAAAWVANAMPLLGACLVLAVLAWGASSRRIAVWGTVAFAVAATLLAWWFGAGLLVLAAVTRLYYRRRFAIAYPSF